MRSFDVVVIGAGPAGEVAAGRVAGGGLDVAIVEEHLVGGECSYYACMPSKALLRPAETLAETRRIPGAAEAADGELDVAAALKRRDEIIHDLDDSAQLPWLKDRGIELLRGRGEIAGERRVRVGDEEIEARRAVILASGSSATLPPIDGLAEARPWTNREVTTAKAAPRRLVIIGGGVVGVEMAQAWASLGSEVDLVEGMGRLLPREEVFACEQVTEALEQLGVEISCGGRANAVERRDGRVHVTCEGGATAEGDEVLVAVGRTPNAAALGLSALAMDPDDPLEVDRHLRVPGHPWLYAIGDVNGRALYTHMGKYQARIAADHILGRDSTRDHGADGKLAPRVIFTDPQVAAVGHTLATAEEAGIEARAVDAPTSGNAGGSFYGRGASGTARIVVDESRVTIVGATFTGAEIADFIHAATIAIVGEVPLEQLWHAVPSFPTRSELWLNLLEAYGL